MWQPIFILLLRLKGFCVSRLCGCSFFLFFFSFRFDSGPKRCVALLCIHCAYPSPGLPPVLKWETAQNNISAAWLTLIRCVMLQFKCSKQGKCIKLQSKMDFCACGAIPPLLLVIGWIYLCFPCHSFFCNITNLFTEMLECCLNKKNFKNSSENYNHWCEKVANVQRKTLNYCSRAL